jgi:hypothetical protein
MTTDPDLFSTETAGLAEVSRPQVVRLKGLVRLTPRPTPSVGRAPARYSRR